MKKLLLTGFDPFGKETVNPALEAVKLVSEQIGDIRVFKKEVPTVFGLAAKEAIAAIDEIEPDFVICVGQAGGRSAITVERIAVNCMEAEIPDNSGFQPADIPIDPSGDAAYFSTLPIKRMVEAIRAAGIKAAVSNTAGTFVCNSLMYEVLRFYAQSGRSVPAGFIHVPFISEQTVGKSADVPSMELCEIVRGLEAAIACLE